MWHRLRPHTGDGAGHACIGPLDRVCLCLFYYLPVPLSHPCYLTQRRARVERRRGYSSIYVTPGFRRHQTQGSMSSSGLTQTRSLPLSINCSELCWRCRVSTSVLSSQKERSESIPSYWRTARKLQKGTILWINLYYMHCK